MGAVHLSHYDWVIVKALGQCFYQEHKIIESEDNTVKTDGQSLYRGYVGYWVFPKTILIGIGKDTCWSCSLFMREQETCFKMREIACLKKVFVALLENKDMVIYAIFYKEVCDSFI